MSGFLFKPTLKLTKDATVPAVEVRLSEDEIFFVDIGSNPVAEDLSLLPPPPQPIPPGFAIPNPFSITACSRRILYSRGMLTFEKAAIEEWRHVFENGTAIMVQMRLRNGLVRNLTVDMWSDV